MAFFWRSLKDVEYIGIEILLNPVACVSVCSLKVLICRRVGAGHMGVGSGYNYHFLLCVGALNRPHCFPGVTPLV